MPPRRSTALIVGVLARAAKATLEEASSTTAPPRKLERSGFFGRHLRHQDDLLHAQAAPMLTVRNGSCWARVRARCARDLGEIWARAVARAFKRSKYYSICCKYWSKYSVREQILFS